MGNHHGQNYHGLLPPYRGSIIFDGEFLPPELSQRDKETLRRLQMIYQMPDVAVNPRQKISKIIGPPTFLLF